MATAAYADLGRAVEVVQHRPERRERPGDQVAGQRRRRWRRSPAGRRCRSATGRPGAACRAAPARRRASSARCLHRLQHPLRVEVPLQHHRGAEHHRQRRAAPRPQAWKTGEAITVVPRARSGSAESTATASSSRAPLRAAPRGAPVVPLVRITWRPVRRTQRGGAGAGGVGERVRGPRSSTAPPGPVAGELLVVTHEHRAPRAAAPGAAARGGAGAQVQHVGAALGERRGALHEAPAVAGQQPHGVALPDAAARAAPRPSGRCAGRPRGRSAAPSSSTSASRSGWRAAPAAYPVARVTPPAGQRQRPCRAAGPGGAGRAAPTARARGHPSTSSMPPRCHAPRSESGSGFPTRRGRRSRRGTSAGSPSQEQT